jgi:hypothetical protein
MESGVMQLQWYKRPDGRWCPLHEIDLSMVDENGVFVVWRKGGAAKLSAVLYVGRGPLRHELAKRDRDPVFFGTSDLRVTWAKVSDPREIDGVASYLYQHRRPMWGEVLPSVNPVPVNLPLTA